MFHRFRSRIAVVRWDRLLPPIPRRALVLTILVAVVVTGVISFGTPRSAPGSPPRHSVAALLEAVKVIHERASVPGYDRECSGSSACVFGPAWSDYSGAPGSANGCSTRDDVLRRDVAAPPAGPNPTPGCEVSEGILLDPYTGRVVDVGVTGVGGIHIDHIYPLSAAWDMGAWRWSPERRAMFANDVDRNLLAVSAGVNTDKSDATPGNWMPPDETRHCFYAARYLGAAVAYGLPVTDADHEVLGEAVERCPQ